MVHYLVKDIKAGSGRHPKKTIKISLNRYVEKCHMNNGVNF
jgi:hypothetical protein